MFYFCSCAPRYGSLDASRPKWFHHAENEPSRTGSPDRPEQIQAAASPLRGGHKCLSAIQDAATVQSKLVIEIERERGLGLDDTPPINGFNITDSGIGLNDTNFDSFHTAFSELKISRGGKGLGRFIWLVAFDHVEIDSTFSEPDADGLLRRKFTFDTDYDPDKALPTTADRKSLGTIVRLVGFKEPYCTTCP